LRRAGRSAARPGGDQQPLLFWIPEEALVEATQIVTARCAIPGDPQKREMTYYALVEEVHRCSRRRGMGHEVDEFDGDLADERVRERRHHLRDRARSAHRAAAADAPARAQPRARRQ
jgi:hypothetical protein